MAKYFTNILLTFIMLILSENLCAQKDVTRFMGIPIDGFKPEMIQKLKSKGFAINPNSKDKDVLNGEFNGTDVNIYILTNNNKVWRIAVADANSTDEENIKIKFNNLIQQFINNKNYLLQPDSTIVRYTIPKDENISYESSVNKKRYQAVFYQKTAEYDSLIEEKNLLTAKEKLNDKELERLTSLIVRIYEDSIKSLEKNVWFMISKDYGKYYITIFYENLLNKANGEGL